MRLLLTHSVASVCEPKIEMNGSLFTLTILSVSKFTANLCCIRLSIPQTYTYYYQMQFTFAVHFGTLSNGFPGESHKLI